ncbi:MAG: hypothetical protein R3B09_20980 [Nannocystaceae bacterium]
MRSRFELDPSEDYGEATPALREIFRAWSAVDWFVPLRDREAAERGRRRFEEHNALARGHLPDQFPETLKIRAVVGEWGEFTALCDHVRSTAMKWDWRYSALKTLCHRHSEAHGWQLKDQLHRARAIESWPDPRGGALFIRIFDHTMWGFTPRLDLEAAFRASSVAPEKPALDAAAWYFDYARMDAMHCVEWQLAEDHAQLAGNPFLPLLRVYAEGLLPFSLARDELVLFALGPGLPA